MKRTFRVALAIAVYASGATAASAATLFCSASGQAYMFSGDGGQGSVSTAGGCAGGPWAIDLMLVPIGEPTSTDVDWRSNPHLSAAVRVLTRLPNRDLRWVRTSATERALIENLNIRGRLRIGLDRLPSRPARSLRLTIRR